MYRMITCNSYVLMISLDLMKSSEIRKAGDQSNRGIKNEAKKQYVLKYVTSLFKETNNDFGQPL